MEKENEIADFIKQIQTKSINKIQFYKAKRFAVSKGGFINNTYRKEIYKNLLNVKVINNKFETVTLSVDNNSLSFAKDFINWSAVLRNNVNNDDIINDKETIIKDIPRCVLNQHESKVTNKICSVSPNIINSLNSFLLFSNKTFNYNYYQGYLDGFYYVKSLYQDCNIVAISIMQKYSEFYLKDFLIMTKSKHQSNFIDVISLLKDTINGLHPNIFQIMESNGIEPYMAGSWILTSFTHDLMDMNKCYRVLDYGIVSEPFSVVMISMGIIVNSIRNYQIKNPDWDSLNEAGFNIDLNEFDFDDLIAKCEMCFINNYKEIKKGKEGYKDKLVFICHGKYLGVQSYIDYGDNENDFSIILSETARIRGKVVTVGKSIILPISILVGVTYVIWFLINNKIYSDNPFL